MSQDPSSGLGDLQAALASVARAIADSLEVTEVWGRVAEACRTVVPFDGMGISKLESGEQVRVMVAAGDPAARGLQERIFARSDFSPASWPREATFLAVIEDAARELDPSFAVDKEILALGFRSQLRLPLGHGDEPLGSLILVSRRERCFTREHGRALEIVAEMVTLALSHERIAASWRERRRRREVLERLIPTMARSLELRDVFEQVCQTAREVIPYDFVSLGLLSEDRRKVRIGWPCSTSRCLRCASGQRTCCCSSTPSWRRSAAPSDGPRRASPRKRGRSSSPTPGRATSASCATRSSGR